MKGIKSFFIKKGVFVVPDKAQLTKTMSKSQVRTGRLLLWQKNPFKIHTNWSDCDGSALVGVFFVVVCSSVVVLKSSDL